MTDIRMRKRALSLAPLFIRTPKFMTDIRMKKTRRELDRLNDDDDDALMMSSIYK